MPFSAKQKTEFLDAGIMPGIPAAIRQPKIILDPVGKICYCSHASQRGVYFVGYGHKKPGEPASVKTCRMHVFYAPCEVCYSLSL